MGRASKRTGAASGEGARSGASLARDRITPEEELQVFLKGSAECLTPPELLARIVKAREEKRPLRIKLGADPSAPDIHLGHTVVLWKLRQIQDLGHDVTFLIGDFTGMIGDPTGKKETRPALTREDVLRNAETYKKQIYKVLHPAHTRVRFNSEWLSPMSFADVIRLASRVTLAHMLERQDFGERYRTTQPIHLHELFYALAQGYDSIAMETDVELGGMDQRFNFVTTRDLQKAYGQPPEIALMMPILNGLDGKQKMSKSLGNYVGIDEAPVQIFGKVMSISDASMLEYWLLLSEKSAAEVEELGRAVAAGTAHPMEQKKDLAELLVRRFHGAEAGQAARAAFQATVQRKELPDELPELPVSGLPGNPLPVAQLLEHCFQCSRGEGRRMVEQGAVKLDGVALKDPQAVLTVGAGTLVQMGKRRFARFV